MSQALSFWEDSICIFNVDMHILSDKRRPKKKKKKETEKEEAGKCHGRERMVFLVVGKISVLTYILFSF